MTIRVMVLSAGDPAGLNFCKSLRLQINKHFIIACDTNIYRLMLAVGDEKHLLPSPDNPAYFKMLSVLLNKLKPDLLYAADTNQELEIVTANRAALGVRTFLPENSALEIYENKWLSYLYFKSAGLKVPETILVVKPSDIDKALHQFGQIWLRAISGSGGKGSIPTNNSELAKAWIDRHDGWGKFTAAQVLTKKMSTWIGLWDRGELIVCQGRDRLHWEYGDLSPSGVTGITGAQSTTSNGAIHKAALQAIRSIPHEPHAIVSVDFTYDQDGVPNPTEIQAARFYSSIFFLAKAGLNLPDIYVDLSLGVGTERLSKSEHPLPDGMVWLKGIDAESQLTTLEAVKNLSLQWTTK